MTAMGPDQQADASQETRSIEKELYIEAPPEVVWRALTEAAELTRWFPVEAAVEPGEGGTIRLSWGEGAEGTAPIHLWNPKRSVGWREQYGSVVLAVEYHIEARGGGTVLRLVHSGFAATSDWDEQFHMVDGGWSYFLENLRLYLERHRGVPRTLVYERRPMAMPRPEAYARLTGREGLAAEGSLEGLVAGDPYRVRTSAGEALEGRVIAAQPGYQLGLTIDDGSALLFLEIEPAPDGCRPAIWLSTYGLPEAELTARAERLGRVYAGALGVPVGQPTVRRSG